ncbi:MAG TPA: hypothetical protein PLE99_00710 [Candidatus Thiothrix moscowensis]|uniref:hypothetical protein n=1 Tax=unclassified Thiothrix TaxID=2636184 RepID=UPI0025FE5ED0|nr:MULTISPECIES: hypothetical protein [unclassified Thiothrix]HRJ51256.1 hypothetical protein [Candidatus Thiothrix moscowensis]HRJ91689.1 hypothetical protein [Candidatus Thiothrix moscowensis]
MYQDWRQWARLCYALLLLALVWMLIKPEQLEQFANWQEARNLPKGFPLLQVSLFAVSAGLIFPKSKRLDSDNASDSLQFAAGLALSGVAWLIALL